MFIYINLLWLVIYGKCNFYDVVLFFRNDGFIGGLGFYGGYVFVFWYGGFFLGIIVGIYVGFLGL